MIRKILLFIVFLILLLAAYLGFNWKDTSSFPHIISAFYAKEFCSCYFVEGRDKEACHNFARQYVPISGFDLDEEKKEVTVTGLGITTTAEFTDKRYGCRLEEYD